MKQRIKSFLVSAFAVAVLSSCASNRPAEIHYGQDHCDYCNMGIADKSFASQLITSKGKAFKFDSIECLAGFFITAETTTTQNATLWITNMNAPGSFVRLDSATLVMNELHKSPMGIGLLGFASDLDAKSYMADNGGQVLNWTDACELVKTKWDL